MSLLRLALGAAALLGASSAAQAEVVQSTAQGFVVQGSATTTASNVDAWYFLIEPAQWWNGEHTWSGDALNLEIDARVGGCFCEELPLGGSAEHMRVIYAAPGERLRMVGALGPLQSEAASGTLTIELSDTPGGTLVSWTYVVGGYSREPLAQLAGSVDMVLGEQMRRMVALLNQPGAQ